MKKHIYVSSNVRTYVYTNSFYICCRQRLRSFDVRRLLYLLLKSNWRTQHFDSLLTQVILTRTYNIDTRMYVNTTYVTPDVLMYFSTHVTQRVHAFNVCILLYVLMTSNWRMYIFDTYWTSVYIVCQYLMEVLLHKRVFAWTAFS